MKTQKNFPQTVFLLCCLLALELACGQTPPAIQPETPRAAEPTLPVEAKPTMPAEPTLATGDHNRTLTFAGQERSYLLHIPPAYDSAQPTPLVLAYHGINLNAQEMARISGFSAQADLEDFVVAYPNGSGSHQSWNGGDCCGEAALKDVDDVGFTQAVINDITNLLNIDPKQVYATGFSNGAIMVYRLACDLADQIAAIGPVGAAPATHSCNPSRPVSLIHFHGDADKLNPYEGGKSPSGPTVFMSVEAGISLWLNLNGCPTASQETQTGNIFHRVYSPCQQNTAVELYKILGGEHAWPGGEAVSAEVGEPTNEIDATVLMWAFFLAHPMP
jgi:polyhydroxybutyrate depolymerase